MKIIAAFIFLFISITTSAQIEKEIKEGINLYKSGKLDEAKSILEELADKEVKSDSIYYYLGKICYDEKEYGDAEEYFEKALEISPNNSHYYLQLGKAYLDDAQNSSIFSQMSLASSAKEAFENSLKYNPENLDARIYLANFLYMAPCIAAGDTEEAIKQAKMIIEKDEKQGRILLSNIYQNEENFDKAEDEFKKLELCCGNDSTIFFIYNAYGYLLLNQERYDEAIQKFQKQIELAPSNANAHDSLGDAYLATGRKEDAIKEFKIALSIDPDFEASKNKLDDLED